MRFAKWMLIVVVALFTVALSATSTLADARINVVHHFGGDVLYCNQTDGCWMLNIHGESLWSVAQPVIDDAVAAACASGEEQTIDAGEGTYGEFTLLVRCPDQLFLVGYDEWGKQNVMPFTTDYLPVNAPAGTNNLCQFPYTNLLTSPPTSGYVVIQLDDNGIPIALVGFYETDQGLPLCKLI